MNSAKSFQRHRMDIINILNAFSEKYIHKLDRSFVDRLLNDGKRLVGDLNDLELEYLGFSLANQLIWASFSSHNTFLRTWDNKDAYLNAEGRGRMDRSAGNRKLLNAENIPPSQLVDPQVPSHKTTPIMRAFSPSSSTEFDLTFKEHSPSKRKHSSSPLKEFKKPNRSFVSNVLDLPMHSKKIPDEVTESKPFSNIIQQHSTQLKKTKVQHSYDISESKPFSNIIQQRSTELKTTKVLNLNEINESHRFSNVMQPSPPAQLIDIKKEPFSPLKFNNSRLISSASSQSRRSRGSSVLELNPKTSIHVPETPDLIEEREKIPIVKDVIPETEYPDFIEEEDVDVPKSRPLSPIISKKKHMSLENVFVDCYADFQDDLNTSSPSILSRKKVSVKENKWGILPDKDSDLSISKKERLKQGKIQSFLRTPKQNERYLCSPIKSNVHPPPDEDDYPLTSTQVSTDQDFDDIDDGPVRKRSARALLEGFNCEECKAYYKDTNLSEEQVKKLLKACSRHRAKVPPPSFESQNERWELEIRDDENDERNITQMGPPLKLRKKRKGVLK